MKMGDLSQKFGSLEGQLHVPAVDLLPELATKNRGVFVGECHGNSSAMDLITETIPQLAESGVNHIFIEHFLREDQDMIDEYVKNGDSGIIYEARIKSLESYMGRELNMTIDDLPELKEETDQFIDIIDSAKAHGIRTLGLDSLDNILAHSENRNSDRRITTDNEDWASHIEATISGVPNPKFLILAGKAHSDPGGTGVDEILGIPSLDSDCMSPVPIERLPEGMADRTENVISEKLTEGTNSDYTFK